MKYKTIIIIVIVVAIIVVGCSLIRTLFYPPAVTATELYKSEGQKLSFAKWNDDLQKYVTNGFVDYSKWQENRKNLTATTKIFASIQANETARDHLLAAYINAYNAFTVLLILEYMPQIKSINDIPKAKRWEDKRWNIAGQKVSLNELEHEILRKKFIEPRIHFAIVCASIGCPHLLNKAYEGNSIDAQLTQVAKDFFRREENLKIDGNVVYLSSILDWFRGDFVRDELVSSLGWFSDDYTNASENVRLLMFVAKFAPQEIRKKISANYKQWSIRYTSYDWNLNGK